MLALLDFKCHLNFDLKVNCFSTQLIARSLPPFSSGSSISETSTGSGTSQEEEQLDSASTLAAAIMDQDHHQADIISVRWELDAVIGYLK